MELLLLFLILLILIAIIYHARAGFHTQRPYHYADTTPAIDIRRHLCGPMVCDGVIYGPFGRVSSRFTARMEGTWDGASGTLSEAFRYSSGKTQDREWHLKAGNDGAFTATADDIIGTAQGQQSGATLRMTYRLRLPADAGGHVLSVTDWMYLLDNGTLVNRSVMRKFGLPVAQLIATMRPA